MSLTHRLTVPEFCRAKAERRPLVVLTAYDVPSATVAEEAGVDALLVGDSLGNVLLGHENTLPVTMNEMLHHAKAVGRARRRALLVVDMPWLSYELGPREAVIHAARFVREAGADAVKLEGGAARIGAVEALVDAGIPVMGHLGLTPQSVLALGGYRVQAREAGAADRLLEDARLLAGAGVFSLVLEAIPGELARRVSSEIAIPTIGIGAGAACDGQVLVYHDLLGMLPGASAKFVRRYAEIRRDQVEAVRRWCADVRAGTYPSAEETYV